jgi:predicted acetyltransferase
MQLIKPSIKYKKSFLNALIEYQREEQSEKHGRYEHYHSLDKVILQNDFQSYVKKELLKEKGIGLPDGYVPESVLWLVDNNEFIGKINVRHKLTKDLIKMGGHIGYDIRPSKRRLGYGKIMLKLALIEAKKIGISKIMVTCNFDNIPSKKIIEKNKGILQDQLGTKLRYWIELATI